MNGQNILTAEERAGLVADEQRALTAFIRHRYTVAATPDTNAADFFVTVQEQTERLAREVAKCFEPYAAAVPIQPALFAAGQQYFIEHAASVADALRNGGADEPTTTAVLWDFGAAVCGLEAPATATPEQIQTALRACSPLTGYTIDKYGFLLGVLWVYKRNLSALDEYTQKVKNADVEARTWYFTFWEKKFADLSVAGFLWLRDIGVITAEDFAGVPQSETTQFVDKITKHGTNGRFITYVYIARYALNATPEQLAELTPPPLFDGEAEPLTAALSYAEMVANQITLYLQRLGEQVAAVLNASTPEETTRAKEQAQQTAANPTITIPPKYGAILGRELWAVNNPTGLKDGDRITESNLLAITARIQAYLSSDHRNPNATTTTPQMVQTAIEGVNLLKQLKNVQPSNDTYVIETNLTEFSNLCGYADAGQHTQRELFTALMVLDKLFVVVWTPKGREAQRLLTVKTISETGRLTLHVYTSGFKGRPQFILLSDFNKLRQQEKGAARLHFRYQILTKAHKEEKQLLNEVFGYDDKILAAQQTGDAEQIRAAKEYKRNKQPRDRDKLRRWFEEYAKRGVITYKITKNKAGETVYSWERLTPPTQQELDELRPQDVPDEQ